MKGFTTYNDRINRATGEESEIDWENLPADVAQALLDKIGKGKSEEDIAVPESNCTYNGTVLTILGHYFTLQETLQATGVMLQLISLIITIVILCKLKKC